MQHQSAKSRLAGCYVVAACLALWYAPALAQMAEPIEQGRDVGDGNTPYDTPYDPRNVAELTFVAPSVDYPYYEVVAPLGDWTEGSNAQITQVRVNGLECESHYLFKDGFSHVHGAWITRSAAHAPNVVLAARAMWHNGDEVAVEVDISARGPDGQPVSVTRTVRGRAPNQGGGPEGWRGYRSLLLEETAGLERANEPVEFSVAVRADQCGELARELRLYEASGGAPAWREVPVQTFDAREFPGTPRGTASTHYLYAPSRAVNAVFLANVPARGKKVYLVAFDNPGAPERSYPPIDFKVEGGPLGAVIENAYYRIKLDDKSGQIAAIQLKPQGDKAAPLLTNSHSGAAHWNPDSYSDNGLWGHTFAWDPPDRTVVTANGPILYRVTNSGRMPEYTPQVFASVSYSFYAGVPYVKTTTVTEVRDPLNASAIRNGELVLDTHLVTHFVWQEKTGETRSAQTLHGPNWQDEWTTRVDHDVSWIAMTNELDGYGVGAVVASSIAFNPVYGEATQHRPAYYLYYHHMWGIPLTYFTRGWVYPFADAQRGPIAQVQEGSTYVEKLAFVPFFLGENPERYKAIQQVSTQMQHPLRERWGR